MTTGRKETLVPTPVTILWENILMLPIVGTIDSRRVQEIMDTMLAKILETESKVIILDILGVPTIDSAVANHIIKMTQASKLMGADTIVSGISSHIAQTLVNLGIEMVGVITTATLRNALELALNMIDREIVTKKKPASK